MTRAAMLINLQRCTGCWTCSMACKVAHELGPDEWWQFVRTLGRGDAADEPVGVWPDLHMGFMPIHTQDCTLCGDRQAEGLDPYCSYNCPTKAMTFGDLEDPQSAISVRIGELKDMGYRIYQLPIWEPGRKEIIYADK